MTIESKRHCSYLVRSCALLRQVGTVMILVLILYVWKSTMPRWKVWRSAKEQLTKFVNYKERCLDCIVLSDAWQLTNDQGFGNVSLGNVSIPCTTLEVLQGRGMIDDPLYRYNEVQVRWVAMDTWTYQTHFLTPDSFDVSKSITLLIDEIDTYATIHINNKTVGRVANAFRRHVFNVTGLLAPSGKRNLLRIDLGSSIKYAQKQSEQYRTKFYELPYTKQIGNIGKYNFIRKPASDFGWDWGPALAPTGIGRIKLCLHSDDLVLDAVVRQEHHANGSTTLWADVYTYAGTADPYQHAEHELQLYIANFNGKKQWKAIRNVYKRRTDFKSIFVQNIGIELSAPIDLWWPWDLGDQPMYNVTVALVSKQKQTSKLCNSFTNCHEVIQIKNKKIGIRKIELDLQPIYAGKYGRVSQSQAVGETFALVINGIPIFAKGSNAVPLGHEKENPKALKRLVKNAKAANMNMLRVWGGGKYFGGAFYDECDRLGILVWQEFMYACATYPVNNLFVTEARMEVRHQAARLIHHPSIIIWGGNNEVEASFSWFDITQKHLRRYRKDYKTLFVHALPRELHRMDPSAIYVDGSPSNGMSRGNKSSKRWGDVSDPTHGDIHWYNYTANLLEIPGHGSESIYPGAKFISEFGYMSLPSFDSFSYESREEDWHMFSPLMQWRIRHENGIKEIQSQIAMHFGSRALAVAQSVGVNFEENYSVEYTPIDINNNTHSVREFQAFIYVSQLQQSLIYETAVGRWRIAKADEVASTAGILYWQLNDVWAGPSWSSCNKNGRWKLLHYSAKRFYKPLAVFGVFRTLDKRTAQWPHAKEDYVEIYIVNDQNEDFECSLLIQGFGDNATSSEHVIDFFNSSVISVGRFDVKKVWSYPTHSIQNIGLAQGIGEVTLIRFELCAAKIRTASNSKASHCYQDCFENIMPMAEMKDIIRTPALVHLESVDWSLENTDRILIEIHAVGGVLLYVSLESNKSGIFSENAFFVLPWIPKTISFCPGTLLGNRSQFLTEFKSTLRISWLSPVIDLNSTETVSEAILKRAEIKIL